MGVTRWTEQLPALAKARKAPVPKQIDIALAQPVENPPEGDRWLHEIKLDGYRLVCFKDGDAVRLLTRRHHDWTKRFPSIATAVRTLPTATAVLDGEVVVVTEEGTTDFAALQGATRAADQQRLRYFAFDLLYLDGYDLAGVALKDRKALLQRVLEVATDSASILYSEHIVGEGTRVFENARQMGVEGIVSKRADGKYTSGRSPAWQKSKFLLSDDFVIGGYTPSENLHFGLGALLLGSFDDDGQLHYVGKVGTGFDDASRKQLLKQLAAIRRDNTPFAKLPSSESRSAYFVEPQLYAQVSYLQQTESGIMRHAVFKGLREDLSDTRLMPPPALGVESIAAGLADLSHFRLTSPGKALFVEDGITKLDLAKYYAQVADVMLPFVANRPLSLLRSTTGIENHCFFQKRPPQGLPEYVQRLVVESDGEKTVVMYIEDAPGLLSLVQFDAVEIHTWSARVDRLERPDRIIFDLDPHSSVSWQRVQEAAVLLRDSLHARGLISNVLVTGGKGIHVCVPIARRYSWDRVKGFARAMCEAFAARYPRDFTTNPRIKQRDGKIYLDYLRNQRGATAIAPYSTRARPGAPVAVPVSWEEFSSLASADVFSMGATVSRVIGGALPEWVEEPQTLPR